jgi:hypothetical protein
VPFGIGAWGSSSRRTVSDDWISALPRDKSETFNLLVGSWESVYAMMSVSLDDALSLKARGELICARQQVTVTAELFDRVSSLLISFCETLGRHSRHLRSFPSVHPLNTKYFRGNIAQNAASWNKVLHRVLFDDRLRFHHKVRILSETLRRLAIEFQRAATAIAKASSIHPAEAWKALDYIHYDLNTCLRENEVLLKSFLRALPAQNLGAFALEMGVPVASAAAGPQARLSGASA